MSDSLQTSIEDVDMIAGVDTDHLAIRLKPDFVKAGPSYWKLNVSLLEDLNYIKQVNTEISQTITQEMAGLDYRSQWEFLKFQIKQRSIEYSKGKARIRRDKQRELEE